MTLAIVLAIYVPGLLGTGRYVTLMPDYRERERRAPLPATIGLVLIMIFWPFYWALVALVALRT